MGFFRPRTVYVFRSGKLHLLEPIDRAAYEQILAYQRAEPVRIMFIGKKTWWMYQDEFFIDDDGLSLDDARILILDRKQQKDRQVRRAAARVAQNEQIRNSPRREIIPDDVKLFVWQRDNGRCVKCGSNSELEFDHIIPVIKGGSNTARNLQLMCGPCNREKGPNLF